MNDRNAQLLEAIKARPKTTEFGEGILTADRYVQTMFECVGSEACYKYATNRTTSYGDVMTKAAKTLTYNNPEMVVSDLYGTGDEWKTGLDDPPELPKNTLMVYRHVLTTPRKDRDGDIMRTSGAKPDPKMLLLWQHIPTLPIGKMLAVASHTPKALVVVSAIVDINDLAHDAAVMVDNKMGRHSHGFKALEFDKIKENGKDSGGFDVKSFEILEESLVSIPSNVDAETQEVLLYLVEGGKLTSPLLKTVGASIRERRPLSLAPGVDVKALNNGRKTETKCTGDAGCPCGCGKAAAGTGTPEKAGNIPVDEKDGTNDKEMMVCPKCGEKVADGVCTKCGYEMEKRTNPSGSKEVAVNYKGAIYYHYTGSLNGSYEYITGCLSNQALTFLKKSGVVPTPVTEPQPYAWVLGTFDDYVILTYSPLDGGYQYFRVDWEDSTDGPVLSGAPVEVKIETETYVMDKAAQLAGRKGMTGETGTKAGRVISQTNMGHLAEAHDNVQEIHDKEDLSRGGKSLCRDAMARIKAVMDAGAVPAADDEPGGDVGKAGALFLAGATELQRKRMADALAAMAAIDRQEETTAGLRALLR